MHFKWHNLCTLILILLIVENIKYFEVNFKLYSYCNLIFNVVYDYVYINLKMLLQLFISRQLNG
jgi:hypothetical protein